MKITPQDIHNHEFKRSIRGYDMDEVDAFLTQLAGELEQLVSENQALKDSAKANEVNLSEYRKKNELLQKTLLAAQDVTEKIKSTSQQEMQQATSAANLKAEKIIAQANQEVTTVKAQIYDLKRQRDAFVIQFKALLDTYYKFLSDLKKSDFEAQSAVVSDNAEESIVRPAVIEKAEPEPEPEIRLSTEPETETAIASEGQTPESQGDPISKLTDLDFDDLIVEDSGSNDIGERSDPEEGGVG
jgi:cell division initiation protein